MVRFALNAAANSARSLVDTAKPDCFIQNFASSHLLWKFFALIDRGDFASSLSLCRCAISFHLCKALIFVTLVTLPRYCPALCFVVMATVFR
jgi:hypothetical protein